MKSRPTLFLSGSSLVFGVRCGRKMTPTDSKAFYPRARAIFSRISGVA